MSIGCPECGGIYTHQGSCSQLPADSEAGRERDRRRGERISKNKGPVFGPLGALRIVQVEAGTVVENDVSGRSVTVTDTTAAVCGGDILVTEAVYEMIKAQTRSVAFSMGSDGHGSFPGLARG